MYSLGIDLADLERKSEELLSSIDAKIEEVDAKLPELKVKEYLFQLAGFYRTEIGRAHV